MKSTITLEGVKQAVFFPFHGQKWGVKLVIGSALGFANFIVPLVPFVPVYGYYMRIMKGILLDGEDPRMPEWNDWGNLFLDGIRLFGAVLLYMLPGLLLILIGYGLFFVPYFTTIISSVNFNSANPDLAPLYGSMLAMFAGTPMMLLGFALTFGVSLIIPPAISHMVIRGEFMAAFRIKEWWPVLKVNFSGFLLSLAFTLGVFSLLYIGKRNTMKR